MKKNNVSISVLSRSRPFGQTFRWVKKAKCPVYVYVHEPEKTLYREHLPEHFNIVTHNEDNIGKIRNLIHKQQAKLGNKSIILDDDIVSIKNEEFTFMVSINEIIDYMENTEADLILFYYAILGINRKCPMNYLGGAYVVFPHMVKIKMNTGKYENEDVDGFLQYALEGADIKYAPFCINHAINEHSHFNPVWTTISRVNMYKKYGDICPLKFDNTGLLLTYNTNVGIIKERKKNGIKYTAECHNIIKECIDLCSDFYKDANNDYINIMIPELQKTYDSLPVLADDNNSKNKKEGDTL